jgi:hypothetical protein
MRKHLWSKNTLKKDICSTILTPKGQNPIACMYVDQSILRMLMRESETGPTQQKFKEIIGVPSGTQQFEHRLIFSPLLVQELLDIVAPNPKSSENPLRLSAISSGEQLLKLFGEAKAYNLEHSAFPNEVQPLIDKLSTKYVSSHVRERFISYIKNGKDTFKECLALHWAFQNLQEPDLHPVIQLDRIMHSIVNLSILYREKGDNLAIFRLVNGLLAKSSNEQLHPDLLSFKNAVNPQPANIKLFKDHVDLEYLHLATTGLVINDTTRYVVAFTFDPIEEIEKRVRLYKKCFNYFYYQRKNGGKKYLPIRRGYIVALDKSFTIKGVCKC